MFKSLLPQGSHAVVLAHLMQWFQPGNAHCGRVQNISYDSSDPMVIANQVKLARGCDIDGFMVDWYGPPSVNPVGDLAFKNLLLVCNIMSQSYPVPFRAGICIDKGACQSLVAAGMTWQQAFTTCYNYVKTTYAPNPAFFSDFILEFGCPDKAAEVGQTIDFTNFPDVVHNNSKYGKFCTWCLPNAAAQALHYSDPNCVVGSVSAHFNDASIASPGTGAWGGSPRLMDSQMSGQNWLQGWKLIPPTMKYVQIVTWNDYEERTAIEGEVAAFVSPFLLSY